MKRHVQDTGVRYWAGDDLIELQSEPLEVVESFFSQFGNMIISGCEVSGNALSKGLVALLGYDPDNKPVYKVAPVEAQTNLTFPVYLTLKCTVEEREYGDGNMKPVKEVYTAELSTTVPGAGVSFLTVYGNNADNKRFADNIRPGSRKIILKNIKSVNSWVAKADLPVATSNASAVAVDGEVYFIGGRTPDGVVEQNLSYNPKTDQWSKKTDMPTKRMHLTASVVDGKIYVIGGLSVYGGVLATVECYDPATNSWTVKTAMPTARWGLTSSVVDGKIYVFGGTGGSSTGKENECYDPVLNSWVVKTAMPTARMSATSSAVAGKIYVLGGTGGGSTGKENECYDPVANSWTTKAGFSSSRSGITSSVVGNKIYVYGGYSLANTWYDPITNSWASSNAILSSLRNSPSSIAIEGRIYLLGGFNNTSVIESNNDCFNVAPKKLEVIGSSHMKFDKNVLWNEELKPANISFDTINPGTLSFLETDVSGEINESLDITYTSL